MANLLEKTINCDDGGSAARIIMDALHLATVRFSAEVFPL
jgi:hypothetical protein